MQEFMKRTKNRISNGVLEKDAWIEDILGLEAAVTDWLNENGYDAEKALADTSHVFDDDTDSRLAYAEQLLQTIKTNKYKGLIQGVYRIQTQMNRILEYYNIGHTKDFYLRSSGLYIDLYLCVRTSITMEDEKETRRLKFKEQLKIITDYGFDLCHKKHCGGDFYFSNTDKNMNLLVKLLSSFGLSRMEFSTSKTALLSVSGFVDIETLFNFEIPKLNLTIDKETENKNKLIFLDKRFKELYNSIATVNDIPNMINTCGYLAEHYLADICKTLDIEATICHKVDDYHKEERVKNQKINEINKKIGEELSGKELSELGKSFIWKMGYKGLKEIGFDIDQDASYIGPYSVNLTFLTRSIDHMMYSFDMYMDSNTETETSSIEEKTITFLENTFDLIEPFTNERYIAYTDKNITYIMNWVNENFHTTIESFEVGNKKNQLYIKSFCVLLGNIECVWQ